MINKPIKRKKYLITLSRDHHFGLLFCWKIKEGLKRDVILMRIRAYVNFFWNGHLKKHFKEEEELIFNSSDDPLCLKAKDEHKLILSQLNKIETTAKDDVEQYSLLIKMLNNHIRFEERILFPHLELALSVETLTAIEYGLVKAQQIEPFADTYPDEFWTKIKT